MNAPIPNDFIEPLLDSKVITNDVLIKSFWMETNEGEPFFKKSIDPRNEVLKFIAKAKSTILISTPYLTYNEIVVQLEDASKRGARVYVLVSNIDMHAKILTSCVAREKRTAQSSFIIIDHEAAGEGIWFPGGITKQDSKQPVVLILTAPQCKAVETQFKKQFWDAGGNELFFGQLRPVKGLFKPPARESPKMILDPSKLAQLLEKESVEEIWIDLSKLDILDQYLAEARSIKLQLRDDLKKTLDFDALTEAELMATRESLPIHIIKSSKGCFLYSDECILILENDQTKQLLSECFNWSWKYNRAGKINELTGRILLNEREWGKDNAEIVSKTRETHLDTVFCESMPEWMEIKQGTKKKEPRFPTGLVLAQEIKYAWRISPPVLPKGASKHRLYEAWDRFFKEYTAFARGLSLKIEQALGKEGDYKKKHFLPRKGNWLEYIDEIKKITEIRQEHVLDGLDVRSQVERMQYIEKAFEREYAELEGQSSEEKEKEEKINEIQVLDKRQGKKEKKNKHDDEHVATKDLVSLIPPSRLPACGTLHELKGTNYLLITRISEYPLAEQERKQYPPCIVCTELK